MRKSQKQSSEQSGDEPRRLRIHNFKNHPFVIPVTTFIFLFFFSLAFFVASNAQTLGASDTRVVKLSIDGEQRVIPTRAKTVGELVDRLAIELNEEDIVEPATETPIYDNNFRINIYKARPIVVVDGEKEVVTFTAEPTPRGMAEEAGIEFHPEDKIEKAPVGPVDPVLVVKSGLISEKVVVDRATPVTLNLYGKAVAIRTHAKTVEELLKEKKVVLGEGDSLRPALSTPLNSGEKVVISREGTDIQMSEEVIAPPVEYIDDPNLAKGSESVREAGRPGKKVVTYEIILMNDVEVDRKMLQEVVIEEPVKRVVIRGTRPLFADYNAEGIPSRVFCGSPKQRNWKNIRVENAAIGRALAAERGWTGGEWNALLELFACESSWIETAGNPYSGAYGIPQSWPATKMASFGSDYMTNPKTQLLWGLDYISRVYGSPSAALNKHYNSNWY